MSDGEGKGRDRREFTTMGDCVNVAGRMSLASKPGQKHQVIVDQRRARLQGPARGSSFPGLLPEPLPRTQLKGKAESVELFAPVGEKPKQQGATTVGKQGRDPEYKLLRGMVAELCAYNQESGMIVLTGGAARGSRCRRGAGDVRGRGGHDQVKGARLEQARKVEAAARLVRRRPLIDRRAAARVHANVDDHRDGQRRRRRRRRRRWRRHAQGEHRRRTRPRCHGASDAGVDARGEAPTFAIWQVVIEQALAAATSLGWADAAAFVHEALEAEAARPCVAPEDEPLEHAALSDAERRELAEDGMAPTLVPERRRRARRRGGGAAAAAATARGGGGDGVGPVLRGAAPAGDDRRDAAHALGQEAADGAAPFADGHVARPGGRPLSWRTAQLIAAESHDSEDARDALDRDAAGHAARSEPGAVGFSELDAEIDRIFAALTAFAERTQSHLKLKPLTCASATATCSTCCASGTTFPTSPTACRSRSSTT